MTCEMNVAGEFRHPGFQRDVAENPDFDRIVDQLLLRLIVEILARRLIGRAARLFEQRIEVWILVMRSRRPRSRLAGVIGRPQEIVRDRVIRACVYRHCRRRRVRVSGARHHVRPDQRGHLHIDAKFGAPLQAESDPFALRLKGPSHRHTRDRNRRHNRWPQARPWRLRDRI